MPNTISAYNTFVTRTVISSSLVNENFASLKNLTPLWQKYTVPYTSFTALGATITGAVTLFSITAGEVADGFIVKHSTLFTGTSVTAAIMNIGKTGAAGNYTDDFDVFQAVAASAAQLSQNLACEFSTTSMILTLSLTGGLLNQLSQGSVDVYVRKHEIPT